MRDGVNGRLVPAGDDAALVAALRELLEDESGRARLAQGARSWAAEHFDSWDARVGRELDLIDELCAGGRSVDD